MRGNSHVRCEVGENRGDNIKGLPITIILGYDWEMGHEEIKLEIGTYYAGKGLYIGMLAKGGWCMGIF